MNEKKEMTKEDYDKEPVWFCSRCLSLKIIIEDDIDVCADCGSTAIATASITQWQKLKRERERQEMARADKWRK